jgi:hypothetical protein
LLQTVLEGGFKSFKLFNKEMALLSELGNQIWLWTAALRIKPQWLLRRLFWIKTLCGPFLSLLCLLRQLLIHQHPQSFFEIRLILRNVLLQALNGFLMKTERLSVLPLHNLDLAAHLSVSLP